MSEEAFEGWAILELMGHRQRPGYVKEVEMAGGKMIRVDIPVKEGEHVTEYYGCAAIYAMRPCTEELVRDAIKNSYGADPRPVRPLDYREREKISAAQTDDYEEELPV